MACVGWGVSRGKQSGNWLAFRLLVCPALVRCLGHVMCGTRAIGLQPLPHLARSSSTPTWCCSLPPPQVGSVDLVLMSTYANRGKNATTNDTVSYTYEVTNNGLLTLYEIAVHAEELTIVCDDGVGKVEGEGSVSGLASYPSDGLAPADSLTCLATASVSQEEVRFAAVGKSLTRVSGSLASHALWRSFGECVRLSSIDALHLTSRPSIHVLVVAFVVPVWAYVHALRFNTDKCREEGTHREGFRLPRGRFFQADEGSDRERAQNVDVHPGPGTEPSTG